MIAIFDHCGFHISGQNSSSKFNISTGEFDIPIVWVNPVKAGEAIKLECYEQALGDGYYGTGNYYNPPDNRVWVKEVDLKESVNSWNATAKSNVTINGELVIALGLEYVDLKIVQREPGFTSAEYPACVSGLCGTSLLWTSNISSTIYGSSFLPGGTGRYFVGENVSIEGRETTYVTNSDTEDPWNFQCQSKHRMEWVSPISTAALPIIITDSDGNNPSCDDVSISLNDWYDYMMINDDPYNTVAYCDGADSYGELQGSPCATREWVWTYSMISTPADAF